MKLKHLTILVLAGLWGCTSSDPVMDFGEPPEAPTAEFVEPEPDSVVVNSYELNRVFSRYGQVSARSYNVETIRDTQGNPAIYVMNYPNDEGFVLVSAKKDCPPVLAYNDHGHFDINSGIVPVEDWVNVNAEIVNHAVDYIPTDTIMAFRKMWAEFENHPINLSPKSRYSGNLTVEQYSRLEQIYRAYMFSPAAAGYQIYGLQEYLWAHPDKEYLVDIAMGVIHPEYQEDVMDLTFIATKTNVDDQQFNTVTARWGQDGVYNMCFPAVGDMPNAYVGCTGVAAGQIMQYYKHPKYYDWSNMPDNVGTPTTSAFLYDIVKDANPTYYSYGTEVSLENMARVMRSRGYSAEWKDAKYIEGSIEKEGTIPYIVWTHMYNAKNELKTHAWLVSGWWKSQAEDFLELWTFTQEYDITVPYGETSGPIYGVNMSYINWGYEGKSDGYYTNLYNAYPAHRFEDSPYKKTEVKGIITNIKPL